MFSFVKLPISVHQIFLFNDGLDIIYGHVVFVTTWITSEISHHMTDTTSHLNKLKKYTTVVTRLQISLKYMYAHAYELKGGPPNLLH